MIDGLKEWTETQEWTGTMVLTDQRLGEKMHYNNMYYYTSL